MLFLPTRPCPVFPPPIPTPSPCDFISYLFSCHTLCSSWQCVLPGTNRSQGLCTYPQPHCSSPEIFMSPTRPLGLCTKFAFSVNSTLTSSFKITRWGGVFFSALFFSTELTIGWHFRHFTIRYFHLLDGKLHEGRDFCLLLTIVSPASSTVPVNSRWRNGKPVCTRRNDWENVYEAFTTQWVKLQQKAVKEETGLPFLLLLFHQLQWTYVIVIIVEEAFKEIRKQRCKSD